MKGIELYPSMFIAYLHHALGMKDEMDWHCNKILENSIALADEIVAAIDQVGEAVQNRMDLGHSLVRTTAMYCLI